jgi:hypothetical protein
MANANQESEVVHREIDVAKFVEASQGIDPNELALRLDRDIEQSFADHRMTQETLNLVIGI